MRSREYQYNIASMLSDIFGFNLVETEWDATKNNGHGGNHKKVYGPRHDVAVGPFNSGQDIDLGTDRSKATQRHALVKKLVKGSLKYRDPLHKLWNKASCCFLAIEIEFSGSSKHLMGSIINASTSGAIGIVIVNDKVKMERAKRMCAYFSRLEGLDRLEINGLKNLIIFDSDDFIKLLSGTKIKNSVH